MRENEWVGGRHQLKDECVQTVPVFQPRLSPGYPGVPCSEFQWER